MRNEGARLPSQAPDAQAASVPQTHSGFAAEAANNASRATGPNPMFGLGLLLAPHSVALIGASNDPTRIGGRSIA